MDKKVFKKFFPAFPIDNESLEKLHKILVVGGCVDAKVWEGFENACTSPLAFIEKIAELKEVTTEVLASAEADILNVPFIKVDQIEISQDAFKLLTVKLLLRSKLFQLK